MSNKAINQLPQAGNSQDTDIYIIVRGGVNYQISRSNMPPARLTAQVTIPSASVLALNGTPFEIIPAAPAGKVIIPESGLVQFDNGSADYATNINLVVGSTSTIDDTHYSLGPATIADRTMPNALVAAAGSTLQPMIEGDSLSAYVLNGDPITGNSDLTVTVWYYLQSV